MDPLSIIRLMAVFVVCGSCASAQVNSGELRLKVEDPSGAGIHASVELRCEANGYDNSFATDSAGVARIKPVPYGIYMVQVHEAGFSPVSKSVDIHSAIPLDYEIRLQVAPVTTQINVDDTARLIDPDNPASTMQIGKQQIAKRISSLPGRSVQDLVNSQPGWLYEGNAVLHPRGSEYQTQFVVDGIPLTDNRSPSFGPEIEAEAADSMTIYTAGIPAEYGRKMGGVVEINTKRQTDPGLHGNATLFGGSYGTASGFGQMQYRRGKNTVGGSASGDMTGHYLNPVVPQNYTNNGTTGDFSGNYEFTPTENDRLSLQVRHELARYEIPNEIVQQEAGQLQNADNFETIGIASYQHIFSANMVGNLAGMVRDNSNDFYSNARSTPTIVTQHNSFREGYFKGTIAVHHGKHEWKAGVESDNLFLNENYRDEITDPSQFDPSTPAIFSFRGNRPDLEQSAFIEDMMRFGQWTVSAGLRWDHYQLLVNQNHLSPRLAFSRYFPRAGLVAHFSYDNVFQTPSFENILLSSSQTVTALNSSFLRLPVEPSTGNYYEAGITKAALNCLRLDVNIFRRNERNFADDNQLLNTSVSFPIAFNKAAVYGAEGKLNLIRMAKLSGFISYSYLVSNVWYPVTGGLFLGADVTDAQTELSGHFPSSQDQRNTARARFQYQFTHHLWAAGGADYGSGLPFEFQGTEQQALQEYSQAVVDRVNFDRGRVRPNFAVNASLGIDLHTSEKATIRFQADAENLNNRLNLIDFNGLFSRNAIDPNRSYFLRLSTDF
jgi:hypothetical protein